MTHQGFIGSLGTSALLVGSAVVILMIASAIVAFEGWPGPGADAPGGSFLLEGQSLGSPARPGPDVVLDPPARRSGSAGAEASSASGAAGGTGLDGAAAGTGLPPGGEGDSINGAVPTAPAPAPAPDQGSTLPGLGGDGAGTPVEDAVGAVDDTVDGVIDRAAPLIEGVQPATEDLGSDGPLTDALSEG